MFPITQKNNKSPPNGTTHIIKMLLTTTQLGMQVHPKCLQKQAQQNHKSVV